MRRGVGWSEKILIIIGLIIISNNDSVWVLFLDCLSAKERSNSESETVIVSHLSGIASSFCLFGNGSGSPPPFFLSYS